MKRKEIVNPDDGEGRGGKGKQGEEEEKNSPKARFGSSGLYTGLLLLFSC